MQFLGAISKMTEWHLKYFLMVFLFVFFFWDPYDSNVVAFNIVLEVSENSQTILLSKAFEAFKESGEIRAWNKKGLVSGIINHLC